MVALSLSMLSSLTTWVGQREERETCCIGSYPRISISRREGVGAVAKWGLASGGEMQCGAAVQCKLQRRGAMVRREVRGRRVVA